MEQAKETLLREALAAVQHEIWAHWMRYVFKICDTDDYGNVIITENLVNRWHDQINTSYANLSEKEKDSDREQADKVLEVLKNG